MFSDFLSHCSNVTLTTTSLLVGTAGFLISLLPVTYVFRYRRSIRRRLKEIEDGFSQGIMVRCTGNFDDDDSPSSSLSKGTIQKPKKGKEIRCLELNPDFVDAHKDHWNLVSLGEYLSSLHPALPGGGPMNTNDNVLPTFIEKELEVTIGAVLLRALGRRLGGAILPLLLGTNSVKSRTASFATSVASWWVSHFMIKGKLEEMGAQASLMDAGTFPFNLNELFGVANLNEKFVSSMMDIKSMEWMRRGEVGYEPSFGRPLLPEEKGDSDDEANNTHSKDDDGLAEIPELVPNPFIISIHWNSAIEGMEKIHMSKATTKAPETPNAEAKEQSTGYNYDPNDRSLPDPTPINPRLLPDLHLGWGSAKCTHTKREIIRNRLLAVLLNKLSYNFYQKEQNQSNLFVVKMTETSSNLEYPQDFVQALLDSGHTVEMCPRAHMTSFGLAVCVKERNGTWSNVPIGIFLQSGYERGEDNRPAHYIMPHGGMDLRLTGPLVGKDGRCDIQFYMAIEGMCGWHSNHNADVPWLQSTSFANVYSHKQAILALKLAGILAVTFNALGTEMDLPYGGYGLVGVCNDTAALLDFGVRGETNMFPLVSTGRFLIRLGRRLIQLYGNIKDLEVAEGEGDHHRRQATTTLGDDIRRLIVACCHIPSDLQANPKNLISSSKRFLASQPELLCFQLEQESKKIMTNLKAMFDEFDDRINNFLM